MDIAGEHGLDDIGVVVMQDGQHRQRSGQRMAPFRQRICLAGSGLRQNLAQPHKGEGEVLKAMCGQHVAHDPGVGSPVRPWCMLGGPTDEQGECPSIDSPY